MAGRHSSPRTFFYNVNDFCYFSVHEIYHIDKMEHISHALIHLENLQFSMETIFSCSIHSFHPLKNINLMHFIKFMHFFKLLSKNIFGK